MGGPAVHSLITSGSLITLAAGGTGGGLPTCWP